MASIPGGAVGPARGGDSAGARRGDTAREPAPGTAQRAVREHLAFIDGFRALAIVFVVAGHCWFITPARPSAEVPLSWLANVWNGGTALFVFISGLLFHHVFYHRWDFGRFVVGKLKGVFLPYAIMTALTILLLPAAYQFDHAFVRDTELVGDAYTRVAVALAMGTAGYSLWYLPFIAIVFAMSPLFVRYIEAPAQQRVGVLLAAFVLGLLVNRPDYNFDKLQAVAYFGFYYLLGIEASVSGVDWLRSRRMLAVLLVATLVLAWLEARAIGFVGIDGAWFEARPLNVRYVEKVVLILACCSLCLVVAGINRGAMKALAADSFGIFFVHNPLVMLLAPTFENRSLTGNYMADVLIWTPVVLLASWAIVLVVKRLAGPRSKMLIGA